MFHILINCFTKKYFQFKGRANRKEYIVFSVFFLLIAKFLGLFIPDNFMSSNGDSIDFSKIEYPVYIILFFVLFLAIPSLSLTIRRLHDLNFSGWWTLFIFFICILIIPLYSILLGGDINIVTYIIDIPLFIFKGTSGTNNYGEPPIN